MANCYVCQKLKSPTSKVVGLLHPLPIPEHVWDNLSFVTGFLMSEGATIILVVVDRLSKAPYLGTLPISFTGVSMSNLFTNIVIKHHGFSLSTISDRNNFEV